MDPEAVLAAYDEQIRRDPTSGPPDGWVERDAHVVRYLGGPAAWRGVPWSDLGRVGTGADVDEVIAEQVARFAVAGSSWEWKHYSHDLPADLPERLRAAGLVPEPAEALMVAELAGLAPDVAAPPGVELLPVTDEDGARDLVRVHEEVFGGDHCAVGRSVLAGLAARPVRTRAVVARVGSRPVGAGRLELSHGTDFAGLWGGGTVTGWRGRGIFRALVAHRAAEAAAAGFTYLQVDASSDSRPILGRLGFTELATTTPFMHPGSS
jgi:ribosomal protein S18 acetylase RimI-like enzyme